MLFFRFNLHLFILLSQFLVACLFVQSASAKQAVFDWTLLQAIYDEHARYDEDILGGTVLLDYPALRQDVRVSQLRDLLERYSPLKLDGEEKLAFYINAYNFFAINLVLNHPDINSIRDIGNWFRPVWKHKAGTLNGQGISLHRIEHQILRTLGEPRIHFAIVCASLSCPNLSTEIYTAEHLHEQLERQAVAFLNNTAKGMRLEGDTLWLSKIFDWFESDFVSKDGARMLDYLMQYHQIKEQPNVRWLNYDWSLNQAP